MKQIPVALLDCETKCFILRVLTKSGLLLSFTTCDVDLLFDPSLVDSYGTGDAWGSALARAENGFTPSRFQATSALEVDNMEAQGWYSTDITKQQIRAGLFDYAQWRLYRVNYEDLSQGHELVNTGTLGQTVFSDNGWTTEFRSLIQQLRQPLAPLYSTTCSVPFGSPKCGKAFTWVEGAVTAVDVLEPDRIFTDTSMAVADGWYNPGVVEWLTGDNAGAQMEVDDNASDEVTLSLNLAYPIQVGDTYRIRQDCNKRDRLRNEVPGDCKDKHDNLVNFRGQPDIPIADGGTLMVPGAHIRQ